MIPARLAIRRPSGGGGELLLHRPVNGSREQATEWEGIGRPGSALRPGQCVLAADGTALTVLRRDGMAVHVGATAPIWPLLCAHGSLPLPPYMAGSAAATAARDYQSMFAREPGAVAAATASLHFTPAVVEALAARGVALHELVLHVGPGTFLPVRPEHAADVRQHAMHAEAYDIPDATCAAVAAARSAGRRVIAVGTTSVRALETWHATGAARGEARTFIYPGYSFGCVDGMVTNFHLPRSTLIMLVAAMVGRARLLAAYAEAIARGYRFYSYGDAMLVL